MKNRPNQPPSSHLKYRPDIDGLRAIAVLAVVYYHALPSKIPGGFIGVDIFFVISGFLISSIIFRGLSNGDFSIARFYANRVKRIFPALLLVLVAVFIFGYYVLLPEEFKSLGKHIAASAGFVQNLVLWSEDGYFDVAMELKPLMHLWSLGVEEQFYLVYPLVVWLWWRMRRNLLTLIILIAIASFILNIWQVEDNAASVFFFPHTRFWELMAGGLLAWINIYGYQRFLQLCSFGIFGKTSLVSEQKKPSLATANMISFIGLFLTIWSFFLIDKSKLFPGWWALMPVLGACLIIAAGKDGWVNRKILSNKALVFIGLISYPLYLWHWPLLSFARIMESGKPSIEIRIAAIVLAFMLSWLTYRFIERPIRFGRWESWKKIAVLCVIMIAVGGLGYNVYEQKTSTQRTQVTNNILKQFEWEESINMNSDCLIDYGIKGVRPGGGEGVRRVDVGYCVATKKGVADAVLIGDSHANALFYGLSTIFKEKDLNLLQVGGSGCSPFFDTESQIVGKEDKCVQPINNSLNYALETSKIKTIILTSRRPYYVSDRDFKGDYSSQRLLEWKGLPEEKDQSTVFEGAMRATLGRLASSGKQVIFVIDVPGLGFNPKRCVEERPLRLTKRTTPPCMAKRKSIDKVNYRYRQIVLDVLKDYPDVEVFDPIPHLCDTSYCRAKKGDQMLYRDENHLSKQGSIFIAERLAEEIQLF